MFRKLLQVIALGAVVAIPSIALAASSLSQDCCCPLCCAGK
jgi:hypothetical protein